MNIAICKTNDVTRNTTIKECFNSLFFSDIDILVLTTNQYEPHNATLLERIPPKKMIILNPLKSWVEIYLPEKKLTILGVFFTKQELDDFKQSIAQKFFDYIQAKANDRVIIISNIRIDPGHFQTVFDYKELLQKIEFYGWIDATRYLYPFTYEHFWFRNAKKGIDEDFLLLPPILKESLVNAYRISMGSSMKTLKKALMIELEKFV